MTHQADQYYIQETLWNMHLQDQLPCPGTPVHEGCEVTLDPGQHDFPDPEDQDKDLTSQIDPDSEEEYTDTTSQSGRSIAVKHK